jgi:hypothetical protein
MVSSTERQSREGSPLDDASSDFSGKINQILPCFFKMSNFEKTTLDVLKLTAQPVVSIFCVKLRLSQNISFWESNPDFI